PVERQQLVAELRIEILVAHPTLGMLFDRRVLVVALGQDVAVLVEAVGAVDGLWVHEGRGVPAARGVEDDVVGGAPRLVLRLLLRRGGAEGDGQTKAGRGTGF